MRNAAESTCQSAIADSVMFVAAITREDLERFTAHDTQVCRRNVFPGWMGRQCTAVQLEEEEHSTLVLYQIMRSCATSFPR